MQTRGGCQKSEGFSREWLEKSELNETASSKYPSILLFRNSFWRIRHLNMGFQ